MASLYNNPFEEGLYHEPRTTCKVRAEAQYERT